MDGTLVDTEPYWIECEYELVESFGGTWSEHHAHAIVGFDLRDSARYILEHSPVDLPVDDVVNRLLDGVIARVRRRVPWRPGARELLADLRRAQVPCALVTMSWRRFADAVIDALPPGSFAAVVTGDDVGNGKPHPEPYLTAASHLGVEPAQCVAIEDSPTGVRSAVAAGCLVYAVPNVVDVPPNRGHTRIDSLLHLDLRTMDAAMAARRRHRFQRRRAGVALAAGLAIATVAGVALRPGSEPPPPPDIPIDAWAPYWVLPAATASVETNGRLLREVSPFWYEARGATAIGRPASLAAGATEPLVVAAAQHGIRLVPSIVDAMPAGGMAAVLADPASRADHVRTIVDLTRANDYAGIDLDYEQFAFADGRGTWEATRPNWVAFLTELAEALHAEGRTLTVSVPPIYDGERTGTSGFWVYDYAAMGRIVDRIRIMAYDYSVSEPGPIAPLDWVQTLIDAAKREVPDHDKLVLGVGLYGRNWVVATSGTCPASAEGTAPVTQASITELLARRGGTLVHDPVTGEASFTYSLDVSDGSTTCTQTRRVHLIDVEGVRLRIDLARRERLGGVSLWALGFDGPATWEAVAGLARLPGATK
jgi:HAD superfamily hydrolase (TIGR01509 family)